MIRLATAFARPSPSSSVSSSANSSPPSRAARSSLRMQLLIRSATAASSRSPAAWPSVSLTTLKSSRSRNRTARTPAVGQFGQVAIDLLGEHRPVREPGQRVVIGLVAKLLLQAGEFRERLLELAVLEGDRRLVGKRLQQPQVVVVERGPLGQPVGDGHRADHPGLAHQRRHHGLADRATVVVASDGPRKNARRSASRRTVTGSSASQGDGHHHLRSAAMEGGRPQGAGTAASLEQHLGDLGPEHVAGVVEQRDERGVELRRVLEDPARLVEQLQPFVLLALGDVGAVGEEHRDQRNDEEHDRARVDPHDRDREQGEAGVGQRDHRPEPDHLRQLLELRRAARQRDRGRDREDAHDARRQRRGEGRDPVGRARACRSARRSRGRSRGRRRR